MALRHLWLAAAVAALACAVAVTPAISSSGDSGASAAKKKCKKKKPASGAKKKCKKSSAPTPTLPATTTPAPPAASKLQFEVTKSAVDLYEDGGMAQFAVRLKTMPTVAETEVVVTSGDPSDVTTTPGTLIFTPANYDQFQPVHLTGVQNVFLDGNRLVPITLVTPGYETGTVNATVWDDDGPQIRTSPDFEMEVNEGSTATLKARLNFNPGAGMTADVYADKDDPSAVDVLGSPLHFTSANFATFQDLTIAGLNDGDSVNENVTVTLNVLGLASPPPNKTVKVTTVDDD